MSTTRPRILFVTPFVPAFTGVGVAMRCAFSLDALCELAEVTLVLVRREANRDEPIGDHFRRRTSAVLDHLPLATLNRPIMRTGGLLGLARRALHSGPLDLRDYPISIADELSLGGGRPWHSMHVFRLRIAPLATRLGDRLGIPKARRVLDLDDVESIAMRRLAEVRRLELGRATYWLERLESRKVAAAEERVCKDFGTVLLCSTNDCDAFQRRCPGTPAAVLPNVYPLPDRNATPNGKLPPNPTVLFVGSLNYLPNQDAVRFLLKEIVPRMRERLSKVAFCVAGRRPPEWMAQDCAASNVELVPDPPDMAPLYRAATLMVVPLLSGGGTRIKILEAFAYGVPVVSTTVGAEGLEVVHGQHLLIADGGSEFASRAISLINDKNLIEQLTRSGAQLLRARYTPSAMTELLSQVHGFATPERGA